LGGSIIVEVFHLATSRRIASEQGSRATLTRSIDSLVEFVVSAALGQECINASVISGDSMARVAFNTSNVPNHVTRNNGLAIKLSLGRTRSVRRGIITASSEDSGSAESGNNHQFFHFILHLTFVYVFIKTPYKYNTFFYKVNKKHTSYKKVFCNLHHLL
jgi:hypothetical protein